MCGDTKMIKIKMRGDKWRMEIEEEFEFETRELMENQLKQFLDLKDKNGRLKENRE